MKKVLLFVSVITLTTLSACSNETIEYEDEMIIDEQNISIEGNTNLVDGSVINYEITNLDDVDFFEEGTTEVSNGSFSFTLDASDYESGEYRIYTAFLPYVQSTEIQEIYGEMGENMSGDITYSEDMDDLKLIESIKTFEKN
ncbi:hypothetical protein [Paraliobacillus ryukyuensis]|uniref:hypothetical protein n=1 Tax=Paraliobacillus ryukyuensis TaxID=200904 RepID=UPI0009A6EB73|nr:hypothetical protein [Paraliobacillus ryukyuensis]